MVAVPLLVAVIVMAAACGGGNDDAGGDGPGASAAGVGDGGGGDDSDPTCAESHAALAAAGTAGERGAVVEQLGATLSYCSSQETWLAEASSAAAIPPPLATITGLRFRCVQNPPIFPACGSLVAAPDNSHGLTGTDEMDTQLLCDNVVSAVEELLYGRDRAAATAELDYVEGSVGRGQAGQTAIPAEVLAAGAALIALEFDDPGFGQALDDTLAACLAVGEAGSFL